MLNRNKLANLETRDVPLETKPASIKHPTDGSWARWEFIDPAYARHLILNTSEGINWRVTTEPHVKELAKELEDGRWDESAWTQGHLNEDGAVVDMLHRLWAIHYTGVPIWMLVVHNSKGTIFDSGKPRTITQLVENHYNLPKEAGPMLRMFIGWQDGQGRTVQNFAVSQSEAHRALEEDPYLTVADDEYAVDRVRTSLPSEAVRKAIEVNGRLRRAQLFRGNHGGFAYLVLNKLDNELAEQFITSLETGANLSAGNPILTLRETLRGPAWYGLKHQGLATAWHYRDATFRAWNEWLLGKEGVSKYYKSATSKVVQQGGMKKTVATRCPEPIDPKMILVSPRWLS